MKYKYNVKIKILSKKIYRIIEELNITDTYFFEFVGEPGNPYPL